MEDEIKLPREFMNCLDIDGDGVVDVEEMSLIRELEEMNLKGIDVDGDGHVDEAEVRLAKIRAGRELMAKRFVSRQGGEVRIVSCHLVSDSPRLRFTSFPVCCRCSGMARSTAKQRMKSA